MHVINGMSIVAKKDDVLKTLKENRARHKEIVIEARKGYAEQARAALEERLKELQSGKLVGLHFFLVPPQDHTKVYDVAIRMMELETRDEVELDSNQVQCLIMDEWNWMRDFLASNAKMSGTAQSYAALKGYEIE